VRHRRDDPASARQGRGDDILHSLGLLAAAALIVVFLGIESRSPAPLLPLRIFRLRTLSAANATMLTIGATAFAQSSRRRCTCRRLFPFDADRCSGYLPAAR
jgi:hypothetical protein